uniref:PLATZ transcription factor family protein n=1 Tax=Rhizophora mucronata TaxID=61149 RepID=A0A2P2KIS2_RHIMU
MQYVLPGLHEWGSLFSLSLIPQRPYSYSGICRLIHSIQKPKIKKEKKKRSISNIIRLCWGHYSPQSINFFFFSLLKQLCPIMRLRSHEFALVSPMTCVCVLKPWLYKRTAAHECITQYSQLKC